VQRRVAHQHPHPAPLSPWLFSCTSACIAEACLNRTAPSPLMYRRGGHRGHTPLLGPHSVPPAPALARWGAHCGLWAVGWYCCMDLVVPGVALSACGCWVLRNAAAACGFVVAAVCCHCCPAHPPSWHPSLDHHHSSTHQATSTQPPAPTSTHQATPAPTHLTPAGLHVDLNGDGVPEHIVAVGEPDWPRGLSAC
jgi:hypothetical protein